MEGELIKATYNKEEAKGVININVDLGLIAPDNRVEYELWYSSVFDLDPE